MEVTMSGIDRRDFVRTGAAAALGALAPAALGATSPRVRRAPELLRRSVARPVVISDITGWTSRDAAGRNAVELAFERITAGDDVLDALIAGVNIPELDPEETGVGLGGLANANGIVQLDACCMHGPLGRAGGVAAMEGVATPSRVARAVADLTDHHLIVGRGATEFARGVGFEILDDLNTPRSRELWLEWKRRLDPGHWLDPGRRPVGPPQAQAQAQAEAAGWSMVRDGLIPESSFYGTINLDGIGPDGSICGVTTTSGLAWKIPGRVGDSPILGAGLYVDNEIGAAGSTGRGEANLYNLCSFLIVEQMRGGAAPHDAALAALRRIVANTREPRLLNERGHPNFNVRFYALNKAGEFAGACLYTGGGAETHFAMCGENGAERVPFEPLLDGQT
ncbi:MAG: isoaspartyl peptidase/L-asparaginase, partial [Longimicrobiales bacterium]